LTKKCESATEKLCSSLIKYGRLSGRVNFPSVISGTSFKLKFVSPVGTIDDYNRSVIVTHMLISYVPCSHIQKNVNEPNIVETMLMSGNSIVYSGRLHYHDIRYFSTMEEIIKMVIQIADAKTDSLWEPDFYDELDDRGDPNEEW
jgi:hypothetical protein